MHPFAYHEFKEIDVEENRSFVTKAIIKEGFVDLGIKKGDALFVHCSIKSFGFVCAKYRPYYINWRYRAFAKR